jgi:hypothetical protein
LEIAKEYLTRVQRLSQFIEVFKFESKTLRLDPSNISQFELEMARMGLEKQRTEQRLKFKSFVFMFDIDDTIMHMDQELMRRGDGITPENSDKIERAMQKYFTDYPRNANHLDETFEPWWTYTGSTYFQGLGAAQLQKTKDYMKLSIAHALKFPNSRIVFNHEDQSGHARYVGHIYPGFEKVLRLIESLGIPVSFTSQNPYIRLSRAERNLAGAQFEERLKWIAPSLKIWNDFNEIKDVVVDKQAHLKKLYKQGLHGLYFDESADYFNSHPNIVDTGFAAAKVSKEIGVVMSDVIGALLRYEGARSAKDSWFPSIHIAPPHAVAHLLTW